MGISVNRASLALQEASLLTGIDLAVSPGEVVAILGPNGAGKTSLLNVITGELEPGSGEVLLNGRSGRAWQREQLARFMAVLPQQSLLNFPFTVAEVVALGRIPHDTGAARDGEICAAALAETDCTHLRDRIYTQLSGGEKQRVQLSRVLAQIWEPSAVGGRILALDEPTSSLDLSHQQQILTAVTGLARQGCAAVVVLHDLNLAARYADRILLLSCGRVAALGTPEQVLHPDIIAKVFGVKVYIIRHPETGAPVVIG